MHLNMFVLVYAFDVVIIKACGLMPPAPSNSIKTEEVVRTREKSQGGAGLVQVLEGSWGCLGTLWGRFLAVLGALRVPRAALVCLGALLSGASWVSLGWFWVLGGPWAALGRVLGLSWVVLGWS